MSDPKATVVMELPSRGLNQCGYYKGKINNSKSSSFGGDITIYNGAIVMNSQAIVPGKVIKTYESVSIDVLISDIISVERFKYKMANNYIKVVTKDGEGHYFLLQPYKKEIDNIVETISRLRNELNNEV